MSAVISQINFAKLTQPAKPIDENVVVGKDILDLLAGSMYVDPLNIYREYIQNAADAIDEARDLHLNFDETAGVQISLNHIERSIRIRDNGVSIPASDFVRRLITIGASQKRGKKLRGFRGVGRLSGLGYCQELIFRGRADGESKVTEVRWNGRTLREKFRDQEYTGCLADIVKEVTTVNRLSADGFPNRFFEVELRKVSRLRNDILLNEDAVRIYLSQVAPVPFSEKFQFGKLIQSQLEEKGIRPPVQIELNDNRGPIVHRLQEHIQLSDFVTDRVRNLEFVEFRDADGDVSAFGWIADHSYFGSIPKRLGLGGIRLRAGNIQVGDELILASMFPEARFAGWSIGDIHIISPKILPNGRRDEFEPSSFYAHLQSEIALRAKVITQRIRERSAQRNKSRAVQQKIGSVQALVNVATERPVTSFLIGIIQTVAQEKLMQASKDADRLINESEDHILATARIRKLETDLAELPFLATSCDASKKPNDAFEKPLAAAIKTILSSAKDPKSGLDLSIEVLKAIEKA